MKKQCQEDIMKVLSGVGEAGGVDAINATLSQVSSITGSAAPIPFAHKASGVIAQA